jgi:hypothetical protein
LRKHSPPPTIKYKDVKSLLNDLTKWYYKDGDGIFLSEKSRDLFFELLKKIDKALKRDHKDDDNFGSDELGEFPFEGKPGYGLRGMGSDLRTGLLEDIGTRGRITGVTYSGHTDYWKSKGYM